MTAQAVIGILAVSLALCLTALAAGMVYFLWQWKKLDRILDSFQQWSEDGGMQGKDGCPDLQETRESRIVSQLRRILESARFKERQAVEERNQTVELIADLSHQFKTPLANIIMDTELSQDDSFGEEERKQFLMHAKSQADKMQWLMADLLKASRLENGVIRFHAENAGIKETVAKALSAVYAQASDRNIELIVEEFQDFQLWHNPKWTAEAMSNLLENAIKYSPKRSCIRITLSRLDIYTKITVSDEGVGIPKNEYNLIFKRFYRGRNARQQEGSGLGLYLAQLIVQHENGYITVAAREGRGSSFSMFLLNKKDERNIIQGTISSQYPSGSVMK